MMIPLRQQPAWSIAATPVGSSCSSRSWASPRCCAAAPSRRPKRLSLSICHGPSCGKIHGGAGLLDAAELLAETSVESECDIRVEKCGCLGECSSRGANVGVHVENELPELHKKIVGVADVVNILRRACVGLELSPAVISGLEEKEVGNYAFARGNVLKAVTSYTTALRLLEEENGAGRSYSRSRVRSAILANRSGAYGSLKSWDEALQDANSAVDAFPGLASAWKRKAEAEEALGNRDRALKSVETALNLENSKDRRKALEDWKAKLEARVQWRLF
jgi:tetratricopeptide (TPR) repeat protein